MVRQDIFTILAWTLRHGIRHTSEVLRQIMRHRTQDQVSVIHIQVPRLLRCSFVFDIRPK
jgi:hypothetical protein